MVAATDTMSKTGFRYRMTSEFKVLGNSGIVWCKVVLCYGILACVLLGLY